MPLRIIEYLSPSQVGPLVRGIEEQSDIAPLLLVPSTDDRRLLQDTLASGRPFGESLPRISRWKDLYLEILNHIKGQATSLTQRPIDPPDHWLIVHNLIRQTLISLPSELDLPPGIRGEGFPAMAGEALQELLRERVHPDDLGRAMGCEKCPAEDNCFHLDRPEGWLCHLYHLYGRTLREQGLFDSAEVETLTEELIDRHPKEMKDWLKGRLLVLAGFLTLSHSQLSLVRKLHALGTSLILLKPATGLKELHDSAFQLREIAHTEQAGEKHLFPVLEFQGGDTGLEPDFLARNLALWKSSRGPFAEEQVDFPDWGSIGIWTDEGRIPAFTAALRRYRIPFDVQADRPVSFSPLWRTVESAWHAFRRGWPFRETAELLSETWLSGEKGQTVTSRLPVSGAKDWIETLKEANMEDLARSFAHIAGFCRKLETGGTAPQLFRSLLTLARELDWNPRGRELIGNDLELDILLGEVNRSISEIENKTAFLEESCAGAAILRQTLLAGETALTFLRFWADAAVLPRTPRRLCAIQIFAGKLPVLAHFPIFIVTGASDKSWPGNLRESALLPDSRKEALHEQENGGAGATHLPLLCEQRQLREGLLRRLVAAGTRLSILSRPVQDEKGRPLSNSPFATALYEGETPWASRNRKEPYRRQVSQILPGPGEPIFEPLEITEQHPWHQPPMERLGKTGPEETTFLSVSSLDVWIDCPFRFWAQKKMGLRIIAPTLYDPAKAGNLVHGLLQAALDRKIAEKDRSSLHSLILEIWERETQNIYAELLTTPALTRHRVRLREKVLNAAARLDSVEPLLAPRRQEALHEMWLPQLELSGTRFVGRADRVDILDDGRLLLFDYKLAKSSNFPIGGQKPKRQLAAYGAMLREAGRELAGFVYMGIEDGAFKGLLGDGDLARALGTDTRKKEDHRMSALAKATDEARELMADMATSVRSGHYPPNYEALACRYCEFGSLCRRAETGRGDDENDVS